MGESVKAPEGVTELADETAVQEVTEKAEDMQISAKMTDLHKIMRAFQLEEQDYRSFSALTLAYIGDCVFDLVIRTVVIYHSKKAVNDLHKKATQFVKAESQALMIQGLMDEDILTEEEKSVYKRGRNTKSHTSAKNASIAAYRKATGFEALIGYLYITDQMERILELTKAGLKYVEAAL